MKKASALADALRAIDGARTRGLDLGKVARYQLRHYRIYDVSWVITSATKYMILYAVEFVKCFFIYFEIFYDGFIEKLWLPEKCWKMLLLRQFMVRKVLMG